MFVGGLRLAPLMRDGAINHPRSFKGHHLGYFSAAGYGSV